MSPEARERSFDELAVGLSSGKLSRGKALKLMGAALVGGTLASLGIREAAGAPGGVAGPPECAICECGVRRRAEGNRLVCVRTQTVCVQQAEGENYIQACIRVCGGQRPRVTEFICNLRPAGSCHESCRGPA